MIYQKYMLKRFGLTAEEHARLLERQRRACAICGGTSKGRKLSVDHDHKTGKVRGLLCHRCNTALERADTIPNWIDKARDYLEGTRQ